jgi:hypothetical protein
MSCRRTRTHHLEAALQLVANRDITAPHMRIGYGLEVCIAVLRPSITRESHAPVLPKPGGAFAAIDHIVVNPHHVMILYRASLKCRTVQVSKEV